MKVNIVGFRTIGDENKRTVIIYFTAQNPTVTGKLAASALHRGEYADKLVKSENVHARWDNEKKRYFLYEGK